MVSKINVMNNYNTLAAMQAADVAMPKSVNVSNPIAENTKSNKPSFGNAPVLKLNTELRSSAEQRKFLEISKVLDVKTRAKLDVLLKNGKLLNNDSNDQTTTLDNLYNILSNKRADGLNAQNILKDVIVALDNPFAITQKFGDIPKPYSKEILAHPEKYNSYDLPYSNYIEAVKNSGQMPKKQEMTKELLNVISSSCVAASIQFNLACKHPAEYARMAEQISSENLSISKKIKLTDIAPVERDARWLLYQFKVPHRAIDYETVEVKMSPDKNAIIRARIQASEKYRDKGERSPIDVLLQSTFMNIGSQHTYNSLTDIRTGIFNPDNRGLTDIEKNLAEVIAQGKNKISVTYQILDESGKIIGYECPHDKTLKHIKDALALGENVIVGYTHTDKNNKVINGHEITIIGIEKDQNGREFFVCNDTDDMKDESVRYEVSYLLPKIHHAGLPKQALKEDSKIIDNWVDIINQYKLAMQAQESNSSTEGYNNAA